MNRPPPTDEQVRTAMEAELDERQALGRRATVSRVERQPGITHATFYRNSPTRSRGSSPSLMPAAKRRPPPRTPRSAKTTSHGSAERTPTCASN